MSMLRSMRRHIARNRMVRRGITKINKGKPSFFSSNWREYVECYKTRIS